MVQILAAFLLIAIIPFMFKDFRRSIARSYLVRDVVPSIEKMDGLGERTNTRYCWFDIPQTGFRLIAEISIERYEALKSGSIPATLMIEKLPFCSPKIVQVRWQGESVFENADRRPSAIYAMIIYLIAGLGFLVWSTEFEPTLAKATLYLGALFLSMSGYFAMACQSEKLTPESLKDAPLRMLGIPIGKGRIGYLVGSLICLMATVFLFSQLNILTLILGFNLAVSFGCLLYLAMKA